MNIFRKFRRMQEQKSKEYRRRKAVQEGMKIVEVVDKKTKKVREVRIPAQRPYRKDQAK